MSIDEQGEREHQLDEIIAEYYRAEGVGERLDEADFIARHPGFAKELREFFSNIGILGTQASDVDLLGLANSVNKEIDFSQIGRYRINRILGQGAFGIVYLGYDEELERQVAIKVPANERFQKPEDAEAYLAEARTVASLDHPCIVKVFDMGRLQNGSIYVVYEFIDGSTLADRIKAAPLTERESAQLMATVARALQHAHDRRLIHRDVKPANILLDCKTNTPRVADFGLAIREEDFLTQSVVAGTPSYMSPEQARGEGHRLDGRSDIFSMGVIFYELLTGKQAFRGSSPRETVHQVISMELKPPRDLRETIPVELERICLKSLSKLTSNRYATAAELADDLEQWLKSSSGETQVIAPIQVVAKGLRSFDASDAAFFLDLLPGPRNREGLPESIAFWKQRIEQTDPEQTFNVGLLYGPSGCGKSSLVKAGLLPHLSNHVIVAYVEATPDETESRILRGLRKQLPALSENLGLAETMAALRRAQGRKIVIIVDQFEQWLHANRAEPDAELVKALRQCDGGTLQAIVMIRDDFAMATVRFMNLLDIPIVQGQNFAAVDLFDVEHAKQVLTKFGQAFGKLPIKSSELTKQEQDFVSAIGAGLARDGKIIPVRLALFAEMVKGKPWVRGTLSEVGGTEGIGINFLDEIFSSRTANPQHRLHQQAARQVLSALLPDFDSNIKGHMRSQADLLDASGYLDRPHQFNDLLRILDRELRLITPTDGEGDRRREIAPSRFESTEPSGQSVYTSRYFQLTHDYIVPSLRKWLTSKQKETRKGRAELRLGERSSLWSVKSENRHLPSFVEWLSIRVLTDRRHWSDTQRKMMRCADRRHGLHSGFVFAALGALTLVGLVVRNEVLEQQEATRIEGLVGRLVSAAPTQLFDISEDLAGNPVVATKYLQPLITADARTVDEKRAQLHARLAAVARDESLVVTLLDELLNNTFPYTGPIRQHLRPYAAAVTERLWAILRDENADNGSRFRAAIALADYVPASAAATWTEQDLKLVAEQLVSANPEYHALLREYLRPINKLLLPEIETIFSDPKATGAQRLIAANAFADYAASDISKLSELLLVATPEQYAIIYPLVAANPALSTIKELGVVTATMPPAELGSSERVQFGQRRANAAVTLMRLGESEQTLSVFKMTNDPEALTQFIFRCRDRGVRVNELLHCLGLVSEAPADRYPTNSRYALILALGEYTLDEIPESRKQTLLKQLAGWYRNDPSSGVHSAVGWLLRRWRQTESVRAVDQTPVPYSVDREWFTLAITVTPRTRETRPEPASRTFHYTFIVFPPGEYEIGSVEDEPGRARSKSGELPHTVTLTRPFALLDREITSEELVVFASQFRQFEESFNTKSETAGFSVTWYTSVYFCRWLTKQARLSEFDQCYIDPDSLDEKHPFEANPRAYGAPYHWPLAMDRRGFRLPTESEWEVACRAGTRTAYGYGSDTELLDRFGWWSENSERLPHPPRTLRPTIRGIFDQHGNLCEWTDDWFRSYTDSKNSSSSYRTTRGGCYLGDATNSRSAARQAVDPTIAEHHLGFRLALYPGFAGYSSGRIEGEELYLKNHNGGKAFVQDMSDFGRRKWSGGKQLLWIDAQPGSQLNVEFELSAAGEYELGAVFTTAPDFAIVDIKLNDQVIAQDIDLYRPDVVDTTGMLRFGTYKLAKGIQQVEIEIKGANEASVTKYGVGVDYFQLTPILTKSTSPESEANNANTQTATATDLTP